MTHSFPTRRSSDLIQARMQMIFQDPYASLNPRWRVGDIIAEPIRFNGKIKGKAEIEARVGALLAQVGLSPLDAKKYPHEFSGGQRQRIAIARDRAGEPEFWVCDEDRKSVGAGKSVSVRGDRGGRRTINKQK